LDTQILFVERVQDPSSGRQLLKAATIALATSIVLSAGPTDATPQMMRLHGAKTGSQD
jgi:hypothetical protein